MPVVASMPHPTDPGTVYTSAEPQRNRAGAPHPGPGYGVAQPSNRPTRRGCLDLPQMKDVKYASQPGRFRLALLFSELVLVLVPFGSPFPLAPPASSRDKCSLCSPAPTRPLPDPRATRHNHGARFARGFHASGAVREDYCWWPSELRELHRHRQTWSHHDHRAKLRLIKSYGKTVQRRNHGRRVTMRGQRCLTGSISVELGLTRRHCLLFHP